MLFRVLTLSCFLFLIVFSIGSALAADDYVPADFSSPTFFYVSGNGTVWGRTQIAACQKYQSNAYIIGNNCYYDHVYPDGSIAKQLYVSSSMVTCGSSLAMNFPDACGDFYSCPPASAPDYTVGPIKVDGAEVCYKRPCTSSNNWFDTSMALGTGTACSFGCQYKVTSSYVSSTGNNAFIGKGTGETCSCTDSTRCWQNFTPNTDADNDETGTCYAWDMGELKGVDCGKNGEMTVDLAPINESLNAMSEKNQAQDDAIKQNSDWIFDNTADIQNLKVDVEKLKEMGCSVSQQANGVLINCNGTSAIAVNGEKGDKGDKGDTGEKGVAGAAGAQGLQGEKGDKGDTGEAGAQGLQGEKGDKGDTGEAGAAGAAGAQGLQGEKGDKGDKGDTGEAGAAGVAGVDGINGKDGEDGDSVLAVQDGINVRMVSSKTGATMATLEGIDKDGIITAVDKSTQAITDLSDMLNIPAPSDSDNPYSDLFGEASLSSIDSQIAQVKTDITDLINQSGEKLNIGSISGGGSYATDVHEIKGQAVDLSGVGLFDMLVANGAASVVSLLFSLLGFSVLLGGTKK